MRRTYTETMKNKDITKAVFELDIYENCKYTAGCVEDLGKIKIVDYKGVTSYNIIEGGIEAEEVENETDADGIDEFHEYLVLHFTDGTTSTFRNSHVDMFIW